MRIRQGRKNKHNLYLMLSEEPSDHDVSIGYIRVPKMAQQICELVNSSPDNRRSFVAEVEWERSEELRPDRLGPGPDLPIRDETQDDVWRPSRTLGTS